MNLSTAHPRYLFGNSILTRSRFVTRSSSAAQSLNCKRIFFSASDCLRFYLSAFATDVLEWGQKQLPICFTLEWESARYYRSYSSNCKCTNREKKSKKLCLQGILFFFHRHICRVSLSLYAFPAPNELLSNN